MSSWDTEERRALRASARRFTRREVVPNLAAWEDDGALPRELHREGRRGGLLAVGFPEAVGGGGGTPIDSLLIAEEIIQAGGSSGLVAACSRTASACRTWSRRAIPALIDRVARPVLAGEKIVSLAITEPEAGSDVARTAHPRRPGRRRVRGHRREALHRLGDPGGLLHRRRPDRRGRRRAASRCCCSNAACPA